MRALLMVAIAAASVSSLFPANSLHVAGPGEIVRKCIEFDQNNWMRMKDYSPARKSAG